MRLVVAAFTVAVLIVVAFAVVVDFLAVVVLVAVVDLHLVVAVAVVADLPLLDLKQELFQVQFLKWPTSECKRLQLQELHE